MRTLRNTVEECQSRTITVITYFINCYLYIFKWVMCPLNLFFSHRLIVIHKKESRSGRDVSVYTFCEWKSPQSPNPRTWELRLEVHVPCHWIKHPAKDKTSLRLTSGSSKVCSISYQSRWKIIIIIPLKCLQSLTDILLRHEMISIEMTPANS